MNKKNILFAVKCESQRRGDLLNEANAKLNQYRKAIENMADYIGLVDCYLCDDIPEELHLKYQPKNDGNYDNESCIKCIAEYFIRGLQDEEAANKK